MSMRCFLLLLVVDLVIITNLYQNHEIDDGLCKKYYFCKSGRLMYVFLIWGKYTE